MLGKGVVPEGPDWVPAPRPLPGLTAGGAVPRGPLPKARLTGRLTFV